MTRYVPLRPRSFLSGASSAEQRRAGGVGFEQRPLGVFVVFVRVTEEKFSQRDNVGVIDLWLGGITVPLPIDPRLADAIGKPERLDTVEIRGFEPTHLVERLRTTARPC